MYQTWTMRSTLQQRAVAATIAGAVAGALATLFSSAPATAADTAGSTAAVALPVALYSVINLGPDSGGTVGVNERGQAAFNAFNYFGVGNGFFDGDRISKIPTLGGTYGTVTALNNLGVVVGSAEDGAQPSKVFGFTWTALGGIHALPGTSPAGAEDINDRSYSAGINSEPGIAARAVRWNPDGSLTPLGPRPTSRAAAYALNELNFVAGISDDSNISIIPTLWDASGKATILGTLGGYYAFPTHINERTEVVGESDNASHTRQTGFFWSRLTGMVAIDSGVAQTVVRDLNDRSEVVGSAQRIGPGLVAYKWTPTGGYTQLPSLSPAYTIANNINNAGDIVGTAQLPGGHPGRPEHAAVPGAGRPDRV